MLLSLIPIIFLEAFVLAKRLEMQYKFALKLSTIANCISTLMGIPLVWLIFLCIEMIVGVPDGLHTWRDKIITVVLAWPWLPPYPNSYWLNIAVCINVYLIFFLTSWVTETWLIKLMVEPEQKFLPIRKAVFWAHFASYAALLPLLIGMFSGKMGSLNPYYILRSIYHAIK